MCIEHHLLTKFWKPPITQIHVTYNLLYFYLSVQNSLAVTGFWWHLVSATKINLVQLTHRSAQDWVLIKYCVINGHWKLWCTLDFSCITLLVLRCRAWLYWSNIEAFLVVLHSFGFAVGIRLCRGMKISGWAV